MLGPGCLLTEKLNANDWENRKARGSEGSMKTRLQTGSALGETEEYEVTLTARRCRERSGVLIQAYIVSCSHSWMFN